MFSYRFALVLGHANAFAHAGADADPKDRDHGGSRRRHLRLRALRPAPTFHPHSKFHRVFYYSTSSNNYFSRSFQKESEGKERNEN